RHRTRKRWSEELAMREDKSHRLHGNNRGGRQAHGGGDTLAAATITAGNHRKRTDQGAYRHEIPQRCADHSLLHGCSSCTCVSLPAQTLTSHGPPFTANWLRALKRSVIADTGKSLGAPPPLTYCKDRGLGLSKAVKTVALNLSPFVGGQSGQNTRQIHPS